MPRDKRGPLRKAVLAEIGEDGVYRAEGHAAPNALALCRAFIAAGTEPETAMRVYRRGQCIQTIKSIASAAALAVYECPRA